MADVSLAIDYVLTKHSGAVEVTSSGMRTRYGLREGFDLALQASLFFSSMTRSAAREVARNFYHNAYCNPLCIEWINDQSVANKLLLLASCVGIKQAGKMLQDALSVVGNGDIGPLTLHALDHSQPEQVLSDLDLLCK